MLLVYPTGFQMIHMYLTSAKVVATDVQSSMFDAIAVAGYAHDDLPTVLGVEQ